MKQKAENNGKKSMVFKMAFDGRLKKNSKTTTKSKAIILMDLPVKDSGSGESGFYFPQR